MKKINQVQSKIFEYQFIDSKAEIKAIIFGNLLFAIVFLRANDGNIMVSQFAQLSLLTSFLIFWIFTFYDWRNPSINLSIIVLYISIFSYEFYNFGTPSILIQQNPSTQSFKGILFIYIVYAIPYVYTLLRLFLVLPLINIYIRSIKLY